LILTGIPGPKKAARGFGCAIRSDVAIVRETSAFGMSPSPLSAWYASQASAPRGLLLGLTSAPQQQLEQACDRLNVIVGRFL
jgi:GntR family transcriptional regulator/MocR family aminotransferase